VDSREIVIRRESGIPRSHALKVRYFSREVAEKSQNTGFCGLTQRRRDAKDLFYPASLRLCVRNKAFEILMFSAAPPGIAQLQNSRFGLPRNHFLGANVNQGAVSRENDRVSWFAPTVCF
jgi:hypothetical protein